MFYRKGANFYLLTSTTDEMALKQLSFTREMFVLVCPKRRFIIYGSEASICSIFIPSKKLVKAAAECETTLGTLSLSKLISSGNTTFP